MNYRQLQAKLRAYRAQGHQVPALSSKKEILESAIKAIESKSPHATQDNVLFVMGVGYEMSLQEIALRCGDSNPADIAGILLELELQGKVKQVHCNSYIYTGKPKTAPQPAPQRTYRQMQAALKELKKQGYAQSVKLNASYSVLAEALEFAEGVAASIESLRQKAQKVQDLSDAALARFALA